MTLAPDAFGLAIWALRDAEQEAKRARPAGPLAPPDIGDAFADDSAPTVITDPARYAASALDNATADLGRLTQGQRNNGLNDVAFSLGKLVGGGLLDYDQAATFLDDACDIWPDRDPHNVRGTIRSGLAGGMRQPLAWVQGLPTAYDAASPFGVIEGAPAPAAVPVQAAEPEARAQLLLASELATQRARREARRLLDAEEAARMFRVPPSRVSLVDELAIPPEPVTYAIDDLLPAGGNALLTAEFKAGKTSTVNDLVRAFCDGTPFLSRFKVNPAEGRIAVFNYEVGDEQYRTWLRELGIEHPDRATVLNLRGFRVPVTVPSVEDWVVQWLTERQVSFWIVDPFARAFTGCGDNENDNSQVGWFLDALDVIKARAGVRDLVLPTHTGRAEMEEGKERSRGATRLEDWCDVRWVLTKGEVPEEGGQPPRFFRATGRGVEIEESMLAWDETDRSLRHGGGDRKHVARRGREQRVLDYVNAHPGTGMRGILAGCGDNKGVKAAVESLISCRAMVCQKAERAGLADAYTATRTTVETSGVGAVGGFPVDPFEAP